MAPHFNFTLQGMHRKPCKVEAGLHLDPLVGVGGGDSSGVIAELQSPQFVHLVVVQDLLVGPELLQLTPHSADHSTDSDLLNFLE